MKVVFVSWACAVTFLLTFVLLVEHCESRARFECDKVCSARGVLTVLGSRCECIP